MQESGSKLLFRCINFHSSKQIRLFTAEVCAWSKSHASWLSRFKNGNLLYQGKEIIFFDFSWHIGINLYRAHTEAAGLERT